MADWFQRWLFGSENERLALKIVKTVVMNTSLKQGIKK